MEDVPSETSSTYQRRRHLREGNEIEAIDRGIESLAIVMKG